jgi:D-arabinose 1-dehydrogenase-like Zn-dependent alcohol dehydrogenase
VRAAVLLKPKTIEHREFPRPAIGSDDALLRIEACGICGSDYEQYEGAAPQHEDYTQYPVIPGHEPLGIIEEIGPQAQARWGVREGDRVPCAQAMAAGAAQRAPASSRGPAHPGVPMATPTSRPPEARAAA